MKRAVASFLLLVALPAIVVAGCESIIAADFDAYVEGHSADAGPDPSCCGNGVIELGEQCERTDDQPHVGCGNGSEACGGIPEDDVCGCDCLAKDVVIDDAGGVDRFDSTDLAMTFVVGGNLDGALRAAFSDVGGEANGGADVAVRVLDDRLRAITEPAPLAGPLRLPLSCTDPTGLGLVRSQRNPSLAPIAGGGTVIAYESNEVSPLESWIYLSEQNEYGCADAAPILVSSTQEDSHDPDVSAGPSDAVLVVWAGVGRVAGRIWKTDGSVLPASDLVIAEGGASAPAVAWTADGWTVVYQGSGPGDADGVFRRKVGVDGSLGDPDRVNAVTSGVQDQPEIASMTDGAFVVVWHAATDIYMQRYGSSGTMVAEDQANPVNVETAGEQARPSVAGSLELGAFYAIAWEDTQAHTIAARLASSAGGFLANGMTGDMGAFRVPHPAATGTPSRPAVAIGSGVVFGWQVASTDRADVLARRFPLPAP